MLAINWICKTFNELTPHEIYAIMQLRSIVFVVEQNCVYLDADGDDDKCYHFFAKAADESIIAYSRLIKPGLHYPEASIGRIVSSPKMRGTGAGKALVKASIEKTKILFPNHSIKIGAQYYLLDFYKSFGFEQVSDIYLEDGIEHIKMVLQ